MAPLDSVDGLAVDTAGNVVISDALDYLVWVVAARAGNGTEEFRGDGCLATTAWLLSPVGLAVDPAGGVLIDDSGNQRIREVAG